MKGVNFVNLIDAGDPVSVGAAYGVAGAGSVCDRCGDHPCLHSRIGSCKNMAFFCEKIKVTCRK